MIKLNPLSHFTFEQLFCRDQDLQLLRSFLQTVLDVQIKRMEFLQREFIEELKDEPHKGFSVFIETADAVKIDVELRFPSRTKHLTKRALFEWSVLHIRDVEERSYKVPNKLFFVYFLDYVLFPHQEHFRTVWNVGATESDDVLVDGMQFQFFEMPKFRKMEPNKHEALHQWLTVLNNESTEIVLKEMSEMNRDVAKIEEKLIQLTEEMKEVEVLLSQSSNLSIDTPEMKYAKEVGRVEGIKEGMSEGKIEVAQKMIEEGIAADVIVKVTNLPSELIKVLHESH